MFNGADFVISPAIRLEGAQLSAIAPGRPGKHGPAPEATQHERESEGRFFRSSAQHTTARCRRRPPFCPKAGEILDCRDDFGTSNSNSVCN